MTTTATAMLAVICKVQRSSYQPLCLKMSRKKLPNPRSKRGHAPSSSETAGTADSPPRPARPNLASRGIEPVCKLRRSTGRAGRGPTGPRHARHRPSLEQSLAGIKNGHPVPQEILSSHDERTTAPSRHVGAGKWAIVRALRLESVDRGAGVASRAEAWLKGR